MSRVRTKERSNAHNVRAWYALAANDALEPENFAVIFVRRGGESYALSCNLGDQPIAMLGQLIEPFRRPPLRDKLALRKLNKEPT